MIQKTALDIARKQIFFCDKYDKIPAIANLFHEHNISSVLVKDNKEVIGIVTINTVLREVSSNNIESFAKEIMTSPVITLPSNASIEEATNALNNNKVSRLVLTNSQGHPVGVIKNEIVQKCNLMQRYNKTIAGHKDSYGRITYG